MCSSFNKINFLSVTSGFFMEYNEKHQMQDNGFHEMKCYLVPNISEIK